MKIRVSIIIAFLLTAAAFHAKAGENDRDGHWWLGRENAVRVFYVMGLFDGLRVAHDAMLQAGDTSATDADAFSDAIHAVIGKRTVGQIKDGMDLIYADSRNRHIGTHRAFWLAVAASSAISPERMEALIREARGR